MCAAWPRGDVPPRLDDAPPSSAPALILSGALDPVTPPRWGEAMARHFPRGRHVVVPGAAHNVSFTGCVPDLIAKFVEAGSADGLDVSCVPTSRPPFVVGSAGTAP
jgi:pimeloyl-ACP methyl ester carboxylesterase